MNELSQWHSLSREEQSIYYEKARQERQLHMELYPGWSARDNYGYGSKKKKRKKDRSPADSGGITHCFVLFIPFIFIYLWETNRKNYNFCCPVKPLSRLGDFRFVYFIDT